MYEKLIAELRQHHCDAREDDTQEVCEECAYDVIIADKSVPSGIASVCVCGLMHRAADAIEVLSKMEKTTQWIPVTERLPEKDTRVIVCASLPEGVHSDFIYEDGHWFVSIGVTHWMPLPEPPKEDAI